MNHWQILDTGRCCEWTVGKFQKQFYFSHVHA